MAIPRASAGLLRTRIVSRRVPAPPGYAATQVRHRATASSDDLGGPHGQQPPPPKPGGPESMQRNWRTLGGAALLAVAAYAYLTHTNTPLHDKKQPVSATRADLASVSEETEELGKKVGQQVVDQAAKTMKEMSGRQKTEQGSFRHD